MSFALCDVFPRSLVCEGACRLAADADSVWEVVGNVADCSLGEAFVDRIVVEGGNAPGTVRHLYVKGGIVVSERIEEYNTTDRYYVYRVIDPGPLAFTHHLGLARVLPAGRGSCIASWISMAQPLEIERAAVKNLLQGNIDAVLMALKQRFG
jgi:hypothetical protein